MVAHLSLFVSIKFIKPVMLSFLQVYTYKNHFYRKHKQEQIEKEVSHVENEPVLMITDECMQHEDDPAKITGGDNDNRKANAFYLLRMKEANLLTQKCVDDIVCSTSELVRNTVESVGTSVQECLSKSGIQIERVPGLQDIFSPNNAASNPFEHVLTKHKQMRFFKDEFGLIVSLCAF